MSMVKSGWVLIGSLLTVATPAQAQAIETLQGHFTFNWHANPARQKCVEVKGALLADFKSKQYRCEMKPVTNTASGGSARVCTLIKGGKEYLIFATRKACEEERKVQESNG